jgi:tRNA threonylcarbamoyladenosine biosynthesis protein TsaB
MIPIDKQNNLFIDTHDSAHTIVEISIAGKKYIQNIQSVRHKAQNVLPSIQQLLEENTLSLNSIDNLTVSIGPGSYTGLRVGVAVAKCIGLLYCIPINGKSAIEDINPLYPDSKF